MCPEAHPDHNCEGVDDGSIQNVILHHVFGGAWNVELEWKRRDREQKREALEEMEQLRARCEDSLYTPTEEELAMQQHRMEELHSRYFNFEETYDHQVRATVLAHECDFFRMWRWYLNYCAACNVRCPMERNRAFEALCVQDSPILEWWSAIWSGDPPRYGPRTARSVMLFLRNVMIVMRKPTYYVYRKDVTGPTDYEKDPKLGLGRPSFWLSRMLAIDDLESADADVELDLKPKHLLREDETRHQSSCRMLLWLVVTESAYALPKALPNQVLEIMLHDPALMVPAAVSRPGYLKCMDWNKNPLRKCEPFLAHLIDHHPVMMGFAPRTLLRNPRWVLDRMKQIVDAPILRAHGMADRMPMLRRTPSVIDKRTSIYRAWDMGRACDIHKDDAVVREAIDYYFPAYADGSLELRLDEEVCRKVFTIRRAIDEPVWMKNAMRGIPPGAFEVATEMVRANWDLLASLQPETREMVMLAYDMKGLKRPDDGEEVDSD